MNRNLLTLCVILLIAVYSVLAAKFPTYPQHELPYALNALEPMIDQLTMDIHSNRLHKAYFTKCNGFIEQLYNNYPALQEKIFTPVVSQSNNQGVFHLLRDVIQHVPTDLRQSIINQCGGLYNHNFFFDLMKSPVDGNDLAPNTALYNKLNQTFGSYEKFKELFTNTATGVFGSGWAWVTATCDDNKKNQQPTGLNITTSKNQDIPIVGQPVLALDVFEHAYFLKYYNDRATYIKNFWNVIDWDVVNQNYVNACNKKIEKKDEL